MVMGRLSSHAEWGLQGMRMAQWMAALAVKRSWMMTRMLMGMQRWMGTAWETAVAKEMERLRGQGLQTGRAMLTTTVFQEQRHHPP